MKVIFGGTACAALCFHAGLMAQVPRANVGDGFAFRVTPDNVSPGDTIQAGNSTAGYRGGFGAAAADDTANSFSVDGTHNNGSGIDGPGARPAIDSIEEFEGLSGRFYCDRFLEAKNYFAPS